MKRAIRISLVTAALAAVIVFLTPSAAQAQVAVEGRFRLPHGEIAFGVGDRYYPGYYGSPSFPVGSYVPYGYRVIRRPRFGYGFHSPAFRCRTHGIYHPHWIPVRRYATRWVVVERPVVVERYVERPYDGGRYYDDRYYDRRYDDRYYDDPRYRDPYDD